MLIVPCHWVCYCNRFVKHEFSGKPIHKKNDFSGDEPSVYSSRDIL